MENSLIDNCKYFDIADFNDYFSESSHEILMTHINVRSFNRNSDEFTAFVNRLNVKSSIMCFSETWFKHETKADIEGYNSFHAYRDEDRIGGGVSIYVSEEFKSVYLSDVSFVSDVIEICGVKIAIGSEFINVLGVYRIPDKAKLPEFDEVLNDVLSNFHANDCIFLVGDLNLDTISPNNHEINSVNNLISHSLSPFINLPTRGTACLDHIWTNKMSEMTAGIFPIDITDHMPVFITFPVVSANKSEFYIKSFRDHSKKCLDLFERSLKSFAEAYEVGNDINNAVCLFQDKLFEMYDSCCPIRKKSISNNRYLKPWIRDNHVRCIDTKYRLFRSYKSGSVSFEYYNRYKNIVTTLLRRAKENYYKNKFNDAICNARKTWRLLNDLVSNGRSRKKKGISEVRVRDSTVQNPAEIAEHFNSHFCSVSAALDSKIPYCNKSPLSYMGQSSVTSFYAGPTSEDEVELIIKRLNCRSSFPRSIPSFVFVKYARIISTIISKLFNASITEGQFPNILKVARVIPIFKAGLREIINNYRPISTLGVISKIFEKLMCKRLNSYLRSRNILVKTQYGFRENSSTEDAILEFMDYTYDAIHNSECLFAVYIDLSKAFDTVNHNTLLKKLQHIGIRGRIFDWFRTYLTDRKQYVAVDGKFSSLRVIESGVPQGSILGPLLFLLYLNDLSNSSNVLNFVNFADDTTVFLSHSNSDALYAIFNEELNKVGEWLRVNRLSLNVDKTCYMIISNKKIEEKRIEIAGEVIKRTDNVKFLGVLIDDRLSFKNHVRGLQKQVSMASGMLNRISKLLPPEIKLKAYYALIYSKLIYGISSWGKSSIHNKVIMEKTIKRAWKVVSYENRDICKGLLNFESMFSYFVGVKFYKILRLNCHPYLLRKINMQDTEHEHNTRFSVSNYNVPFYSKSKCQQSFLYQSIHVWNNIPLFIRNCDSLKLFKGLYKNYLLTYQ